MNINCMNITNSLINYENVKKTNKILPIIIIGSGVSGLTIASKIKDNNFLILEARDRIGGRVFTNERNMFINKNHVFVIIVLKTGCVLRK